SQSILRASFRFSDNLLRERPDQSCWLLGPEGAGQHSPGQRPGERGYLSLSCLGPEGAEQHSPGQRPGERGRPCWFFALKGHNRRHTPVVVPFQGERRKGGGSSIFPGRCPGLCCSALSGPRQERERYPRSLGRCPGLSCP